ncbi:MAG: tRNA pseudouridine(54/55) synthase Pus10 [Nitrososphaeria archaeon]|nr:tRNA pseudouridine(54/55) synthase Pus10 [Nitrososphaeria archaeon]
MSAEETPSEKDALEIIRIASDILNIGYVCDKCLGRTFSKLLHGMPNEEKGRSIRNFIALLLDSGVTINVKMENFQEYNFRRLDKLQSNKTVCFVCENIFSEIVPKLVKEAIKKAKRYEFETFLVGTVLNKALHEKDQMILKISPNYSESIKDEINRILGKSIVEKFGKSVNYIDPQLQILVNLKKLKVEIRSKNLYIYGGYKKLVRGIPQTTWYCKRCRGKGCKNCNWKGKMYRSSVQQIIEKPLIRMAKGKKSSFHGSGREDIDVRCLDYRPFVIEIVDPKIRNIDLYRAKTEINRSKYVQVSDLKFASKDDVISVKEAKNDKVYRAIVTFSKNLDKRELEKLSNINNVRILQKTPIRVLHRRADLLRERVVKRVEYRILSKRRLELIIECDAGTYVKEFIHGDEGRTKPSIAEILQNKVKKIILDVIEIKK